MSARPFPPVWVALPSASMRRIDNAFEALECLTTSWPIMTSPSYRRAVQACRDALDGFVSAKAARKAFVAAARDVRALAKGGPVGLPQDDRLVPTVAVSLLDGKDFHDEGARP
jgi:hypothetical protein